MTTEKPQVRVSLACLSCRQRHARCDAIRPICTPCAHTNRPCSYARSQRSGRCKRAVTRGRSDEQLNSVSDSLLDQDSSNTFVFRHLDDHLTENTSTPTLSLFNDLIPRDVPLPNLDNCGPVSVGIDGDYATSEAMAAFYEFFHNSHPFVLPQLCFETRLVAGGNTIQALASVMAYVGSFYTNSIHKAQLEEQVERRTTELLSEVTGDGFVVQTLLLMALVRSMCNDHDAAMTMLYRSINLARSIGMQKQVFASEHSEGDLVLAESWRRTWWMLCLTEANFAVIVGSFHTTLDVFQQDVELPCEESCYNTGVSFSISATISLH